ncbi:hypothetical protein [Rhizobium leguminosarum]|uniref:Uncharacterized protein n=1 Tax=Rhizobium leguminosarum TaxID=384 RepID=A0A7K3VEW8_RHILE|nr:hypothetical protein [Rhizobium leguminosarum]NEK15699.1 hypothetical protein [Rhizobium leguminosarum]
MPPDHLDVVDAKGGEWIVEIHQATGRPSINGKDGKAADGGITYLLLDTRKHFRGDLRQNADGTFSNLATGETYTLAD